VLSFLFVFPVISNINTNSNLQVVECCPHVFNIPLTSAVYAVTTEIFKLVIV